MTEIFGKIVIDYSQAMEVIDRMQEMLRNVKLSLKKEPDLNATMKKKFLNIMWLCANGVQQRVSELWESRIKGGEVNPPLAPSTVWSKENWNFGTPEAPLYATGALAESITFGEVTETSIEIVSDSPTALPSWHGASLYAGDHRATNTPERIVITKEEFDQIAREEYGAARIQDAMGVIAEKPDMLKSVNVNISVNVATTESMAEAKRKKQKKVVIPVPMVKNG